MSWVQTGEKSEPQHDTQIRSQDHPTDKAPQCGAFFTGQVTSGAHRARTGVAMTGLTVFPKLRAVGTPDNIDLQLEGKGTGLVRFGSRTATADAASTGYIEIKDILGIIRKLAVIG